MNPQLVREVMEALDATPERIRQLTTLPFPKAVESLNIIKEEAKKRYKKLAFEWHPDRNPSDPIAEERFKTLGAVMADLNKLQFRPPPPVVQYVHFPAVSPFGSSVSFTYSPTSATTTSVGYNAVRVAFIRVV
jgi:hypothetical protein